MDLILTNLLEINETHDETHEVVSTTREELSSERDSGVDDFEGSSVGDPEEDFE
jgi:hypothetical protein